MTCEVSYQYVSSTLATSTEVCTSLQLNPDFLTGQFLFNAFVLFFVAVAFIMTILRKK